MPTQRELWERFRRDLCHVPSIGLALDVSRMDLDDAWLASMAAAVATINGSDGSSRRKGVAAASRLASTASVPRKTESKCSPSRFCSIRLPPRKCSSGLYSPPKM